MEAAPEFVRERVRAHILDVMCSFWIFRAGGYRERVPLQCADRRHLAIVVISCLFIFFQGGGRGGHRNLG